MVVKIKVFQPLRKTRKLAAKTTRYINKNAEILKMELEIVGKTKQDPKQSNNATGILQKTPFLRGKVKVKRVVATNNSVMNKGR